ncbi:hypothetical protein EON65_49980 [archaeon]|nr:MAG: hypothetical protein EON65_49980 [archaeon]
MGWQRAIKTTYPLSVRKGEIIALNKTLQTLEKGQYITVIGGKGNGKSCRIDTCLNRSFGVVKTSVS